MEEHTASRFAPVILIDAVVTGALPPVVPQFTEHPAAAWVTRAGCPKAIMGSARMRKARYVLMVNR